MTYTGYRTRDARMVAQWLHTVLQLSIFLLKMELQDIVVKLEIFFFQKQPPEMFYKKNFLKFLQNSQENTCAKVSFLIKLQDSDLNGDFFVG